jgi:transposase-like protein
MPWRSVSVMEEKEEFILHFKSGKYTVSALAQMFDISRPTAYKFSSPL